MSWPSLPQRRRSRELLFWNSSDSTERSNSLCHSGITFASLEHRRIARTDRRTATCPVVIFMRIDGEGSF